MAAHIVSLLQTVDNGEVAYVLTQVNSSWSQLTPSNLTSTNYYSEWLAAWLAQAEFNYQSAEDNAYGLDTVGRMHAYLKASNYFFVGECFAAPCSLWFCMHPDEPIVLSHIHVVSRLPALETIYALPATAMSIVFERTSKP